MLRCRCGATRGTPLAVVGGMDCFTCRGPVNIPYVIEAPPVWDPEKFLTDPAIQSAVVKHRYVLGQGWVS